MVIKGKTFALRLTITSCAVVAMTGAAVADSMFKRDANMCFQRTYSPAHMKKHPQQTVTFIQVTHDIAENRKLIGSYSAVENAGSEALIEVKVRFKGSSETYSNSLLCFQDNKYCSVECDGGSGIFTRKTDGDMLLDVRETGGFIVQGGCDGSEDTVHRRVGDAPDDKLFKLFQADMAICRAPNS